MSGTTSIHPRKGRNHILHYKPTVITPAICLTPFLVPSAWTTSSARLPYVLLAIEFVEKQTTNVVKVHDADPRNDASQQSQRGAIHGG